MEANKRPNNWLLIKFREWHTWLGVFLSGFVLLICGTGIYLNHKDFFKNLLSGNFDFALEGKAHAGEPGSKKKPEAGTSATLLSTTMNPSQLPVNLDQALSIARHQWGEVPLERIELKQEHGQLCYKIKQFKGPELVINAQTGEAAQKGKPAETVGWERYQEEPRAHAGDKNAGINWGKLMMDLHTGKILGGPGKLLVDLTSLVIIILTLTGIYLWIVPKWRKYRSARQRATAQHRADPVNTPPVPATI